MVTFEGNNKRRKEAVDASAAKSLPSWREIAGRQLAARILMPIRVS